ncbi:MAG: hypothetical protein HY905_05935 [Deltaproteobacteria bacterium]|nr:hypothetical protein [Deltaproteobacteria bacterium]
MDLPTSTRPRATVRGWTAARLLAALPPAESSAARARLVRGSRAARWLEEAESLGAPPPPAATPHASWLVAALRALPARVARLHLDRLGPAAARDAERMAPGLAPAAIVAPADPSPFVDALIGRLAPPAFPCAPAWARPPGVVARVASAAAREDWPVHARPRGGADLVARVAVLSGASAAAAIGFARLAFALLLRPDEARGLAGTWPRQDGRTLLAAWNAWPEATELDAATMEACEAAAGFVAGRWPTWAA